MICSSVYDRSRKRCLSFENETVDHDQKSVKGQSSTSAIQKITRFLDGVCIISCSGQHPLYVQNHRQLFDLYKTTTFRNIIVSLENNHLSVLMSLLYIFYMFGITVWRLVHHTVHTIGYLCDKLYCCFRTIFFTSDLSYPVITVLKYSDNEYF